MSGPRVAAVVFGALILQVCLFAQFSYDGARPDVMILVAILGGFVLGPERGAVVGFSAGISFDVLLNTPLGLSALVYTLVAYVVGSLAGGVLRSSWWIAPAVVAVASAVGMLVYAVVGEVLGLATLSASPLAAIVVVVPAVNAVLAPLAGRALRWTRTDDGVHHRHRQPFLPR